HEVTLPTFLDPIALLDLNDCPSPVGHAVGDVDVHDNARLHAFAQLEHRSFADGSVDVVVVESVDAQGKDDRLRVTSARGNGSHMEGGGLVGLPHITRPFRVKMKAALDTGLLRLCGFEAPVTRIDITFEHDFSVGESHGINRARFDQTHGRTLHCTRDTDFVAALGQDDIVEAGACE